MRILLDTNIIIQRENNQIVPENLAELMKLFNGLENCSLHIHPLTQAELKKDKHLLRQEINISKSNTYSILDKTPDYLKDEVYISKLPTPKNENDIVDNQLLYCIYKNICTYLITEDQGILNKASKLDIENVLSINEAINAFKKLFTNYNITLSNDFELKKAFELNHKDEIFDSLRNSYNGFDKWWNKIQNRDTYVHFNQNGAISAILIPKIEENEIICNSPITIKGKILKICTFKVANHARGFKLGERLIDLAIKFACKNNLEEIYLTHFIEENDYLVNLIESFGFKRIGLNANNEDVFLKQITANKSTSITNADEVVGYNNTYYPAFYQGNTVKKHLIPIQPEFHKRLFPDSKGDVYQLGLNLFNYSESNCIKKAYICNANTTKVNKGDILLFYQSKERMALTTLCTVQNVYSKMTDPELVSKLIAKRTVFNFNEIKKICAKEALVLLFNENFHLKKEIKLNELPKLNITGNIYSIREITDEQYRELIKGNIDERYTIN